MRTVRRGDIYYIKSNVRRMVSGSEQDISYRPGVVISNDVGNKFAPTVIIALLTTQDKKSLPVHTQVMGVEMSTVLSEQIYTVDKTRLGDYIRHANSDEMQRVDDIVKISLGV